MGFTNLFDVMESAQKVTVRAEFSHQNVWVSHSGRMEESEKVEMRKLFINPDLSIKCFGIYTSVKHFYNIRHCQSHLMHCGQEWYSMRA